MACIGDEIGMGPRDIGFGGLVDEFDDGKFAGQRLAVDPPDIGAPRQAADDRTAVDVAPKARTRPSGGCRVARLWYTCPWTAWV